MSVIGIDGGKSGAIAYLRDNGNLQVWDIPLRSVVVGGKERRELDPRAYLASLHGIVGPYPGRLGVRAYVERNREIPRTGADGRRQPQSGMYEFGFTNGMLVMGLAACDIDYTLVEPQAWKRAVHLLGKDKEASRAKASELFPAFQFLWPNKGHHGRAEAALIAYYGLHNPLLKG
jgi:crossover junction endodeoxyribonuclease RuvC